jgi:hypothetical protein
LFFSLLFTTVPLFRLIAVIRVISPTNVAASLSPLPHQMCNNVVPHLEGTTESGKLIYQAESPDEEALVEGAAELGVQLLKRSTSNCVLQVSSLNVVTKRGDTFWNRT